MEVKLHERTCSRRTFSLPAQVIPEPLSGYAYFSVSLSHAARLPVIVLCYYKAAESPGVTRQPNTHHLSLRKLILYV